ncbi:MAG TPA: hypothetical protein P5218_03120 [Planctomycetota bacterium]|nr:hypothetical protein [Planctomycetota bacterium]HPF12638.1 hypothetical protein [Planctomycetota bacterium]HRV80396.1 hypothetical protein [Planctomycetota bacterium]
MQHKASIATWKSTLVQSAIVVVGYALGVLAWRTFMVPHFSGLRLGEPALVRPTELWRPNLHGVVYRYQDPKPGALVVAGDSRVQRGVVLDKLEDAGLAPVYALTRPAAQTLDLLRVIDEQLPARAVIALSPLGLENDQSAPLAEEPDHGSLPRRIDAWTSDWADMYRRRLAEPMIPPAWRYGWFGGFGQDKFFRAFEHSLRPETRASRLEKLDEVRRFLGAMKDKGWHIACVRIPTYGPMRAIEDEAFDPELFVSMCLELGLPYIDYGATGEYPTSDGSHLGVAGARAWSARLAQDLLKLPGMVR